MGLAARLDAVLARKLRQIMRGRLTLDGGVGGDDQLADLATGQALGQHIQAQFTRAEAIEWRQPALQYEVQAAIAGRLLHRQAICRRFQHAQQMRVAAGARSEERRVGKECASTCRSRGSPSPRKKKK